MISCSRLRVGACVRTAASAVILMTLFVLPAAGQEIFKQDENLYVTRELRATAPLKSGELLLIRSAETLSGRISIRAAKTDRALVTYTKRANTDSRSRAVDYIDLIAVDLGRVAQGARLQLRAPNPAPWSGNESGSIDAEIQVPEGVIVDVEALYFDIVAEGPLNGVKIPESLGRLEVYHVNGPVELKTSNRRVVVEDVTGDIAVQTSNSTITATNIKSLTQQAVFRNDGGEISIDGFTGEISARNDFGRIEITDFTPVGRRNVIRGQSAPIVLDVTRLGESQLIVSNRLEDIDISVPSTLSAEMTLAVGEEGKIEVVSLKFQTDLVQSDRLGLVVGDGAGFISGSISGRGNIYIRGREDGED